jgi:hypothetical protein
MGKRSLVAYGVAVALLAPAVAKAETFNFDNYCITGGFPVCASVRLTSVGNHLTMQVWNLNGTLGLTHTITSVGLYHNTTAFTGQVDQFHVNYVNGGSTDITKYWSTKGATDIKTLGGVNVELAEGTKGNNGIIGCTNPGGGTKWATCNTFPNQAYVQFDFTFKNNAHFSLDGVELRWHSQQIVQVGSLKCDTGGNGDYPPCEGHVVPEPMTMALLATGLMGLGGSGFVIRRRKKGEVVAD